MLHFDCDYMEGACPEIMERLLQTNLEQTPGYGTDKYTESAKEKIRIACNAPEAQVWFLIGGTQTNATVLDALLAPGDGVIAADTGHIGVHEAGAVENSGHKVLPVASPSVANGDKSQIGKLSAESVRNYLSTFWNDGNCDHMVAPGAVYISHPTEYGTFYTAKELASLHQVCAEYKIPLFLDGARLGYALASPSTDVTLPVIASNCDAFYIGGTKVGCLFGEAVVFPKPQLVNRFFTTIKRHGALLAKGRLLGIQFETLFTDGLYSKIARNAIDTAVVLRKELLEKGYKLAVESDTNQVFVILENERMKELEKSVTFSFWEKYDSNHTVVRFATSWVTKMQDVQALCEIL